MRIPKKHIISLIKITNFPEDFLAGNLYFNRLQYFREAEMKEIGDKFEATAVSEPSYTMVDSELLPNPVFCMYSVEAKKQDDITRIQLNDPRLRDFGHYAVVIKDVKEFIQRIRLNLSRFIYEAVRYIDIKHPKGIYQYAVFNPIVTKDRYFEYQQEFRIFSHAWALSSNSEFQIPNVTYLDEIAKKFAIGNLKDIAHQYKTDDLFTGVDIELNVDWNFCRIDRFQTKLPKMTS
jgi:hypothetical protein